MNLLRNGLIGAILVVVFLLFIRWNEFQERQVAENTPVAVTSEQVAETARPSLSLSDDPAIPSSNVLTETAEPGDDLPTAPETVANSAKLLETSRQTSEPSRQFISVKTDTLDILIDPKGGDITQVALPQHASRLDDKNKPFLLLGNSGSHTYIAQSDLIGANGTHTRDTNSRSQRVIFDSASRHYQLSESAQGLKVDLTHKQANGTFITKRFIFERGSYRVKVNYLIDNRSTDTWNAAMYGRIKRDDYKPKAGGMFQLQPFLGAATTTTEDTFKKYDFEDIRDDSVKFDKEGGWVAMVQHYFVSAWVPDANTENSFKLYRSSDKVHYMLQFTTPQYSVAPGQMEVIQSSFYAGPKIIKNLETIAPGLDLTIDFGVLWFVAKPLFIGLDVIHGFVGNWGFAIILLTFLIKLVFFYPSAISYRSMAKMRKLMPKMQDLKERFGDDRQRMGQETMKLYKKEGVNPLGGCLPMLMQMPVFMALYWMIMESVELRHSPFLFWVQDLSVKDPFFVLPVVMGGIMFVQQKLNPPPQDPMQQKIFQFMPIGFTFILAFLPAALTLYMAVNTALSFLQQYLITKQIEKAD
ncbi:MAG: membrane protein insertase YidC [Agarilytica sp.]